MEKISNLFKYIRFFVLWSCGCVFSDKLLKDLGIKEKKCPICNKPYNKNEMIE